MRTPRNLGVPSLGGGIGAGAGVVVETVLTFFLVRVVFATAEQEGRFEQIAGLVIGFTIAFDILMGGVTGAAMNPARLRAAARRRPWSNWWVWYVGPFAGGVIAAALYEMLYLRSAGPEPVGPPETGLEEPTPGEAAEA